MVNSSDFVVELKHLDKDDTPYVGGKNANLGEMIQAGFPVPGGFAVTAYAYFHFLKVNGLDIKIKHLLASLNKDDSESLNSISSHIRKLISSAEIPQEIATAIFSEYKKISGRKDVLVAVRSSATSEDSKEASFAGQNETFLNILGEASVLGSVRLAWASLFEARSVYYREENKIPHLKTGIAVVVQRMVESESSGIMFTVDPVTGDKSKIIIESIFGLGEYIVQGRITPDHYEVDKTNFEIINKKVVKQDVMLTKKGSGNKEVKVGILSRGKQKVTDDDIKKLAKIALDLEKHYYFPQDIEWAKEKGHLYIVQTRPITTIGKKNEEIEKQHAQFTDAMTRSHGSIKKGDPILVGDPASPGIGIGRVKVLSSPKDIGKVESGDILVAPYTNPDYVPAMKKSAAILTEHGGRTSHAAIVSREFGIPAVVGVPQVTTKLKDGMIVTVDGKKGEIYAGSVLIKEEKEEEVHYKTATKIFVNLAEPELAEKIAEREIEGVGLLRAEFMIAQIGIHPKKLIKEKKEKIFIEKMTEGLETFCKAFYPRPILYRATDFKTNEYRNLTGGREFEPEEPNPMIGYRGAYRYVSDPAVFELELEAIKQVREKRGFNNLNLMIPFVRTVKELEDVKKIIHKVGLRRSHTFKLYMMVEIPSNVILIDDFIEAGIDGISIGSNDLTMLVLGTDRDNSEVAQEYDEQNPAVEWALERVIKRANEHRIPVSICGQAPSVYPSLVKKLVEWGVTGVSVSPDAIDTTRRVVHEAEMKIIKEGKSV